MPESRDRELLIDAAESALAARGVHGSSLREITQAAGVRNKSAVQYHFGDRVGLVHAVLARRGETLRIRRALMLEEFVSAGLERDPRAICRVVVEPYCRFLDDGDGALAYLVLVREVMSDPARPYESLPDLFGESVLVALVDRLLQSLDAPSAVRAERALFVVSSVVGAVADRGRWALHPGSPRPQTPTPVFVRNLVDMVLAAVTAPVDQSTADALAPISTGAEA